MNSKERFSDRVDHYVKYRPDYPTEAIDFLYNQAGFSEKSLIADVGSGTGIFSRLLLQRGSSVIGIEPNDAMREAAIQELGHVSNYFASAGSAEQSGLSSASVDFIVCAQSYHWFDKELARAEFQRILKPGGKVVLIWNSRKTIGSPFLEQFEKLLLTYGKDYVKVGHKSITIDTLRPYFTNGGPELHSFSMKQLLDEQSLRGRLLSSSYSPLPNQPGYEDMMKELIEMYNRTAKDGFVEMEYATELYIGEV